MPGFNFKEHCQINHISSRLLMPSSEVYHQCTDPLAPTVIITLWSLLWSWSDSARSTWETSHGSGRGVFEYLVNKAYYKVGQFSTADPSWSELQDVRFRLSITKTTCLICHGQIVYSDWIPLYVSLHGRTTRVNTSHEFWRLGVTKVL